MRVPTPESGPLSGVLENRYPTLGRDVISQIFGAGNVVDCRGRRLGPDVDASEVPEGVWIYRPIHDEPDEPIAVDVVVRGRDWLVVDKPHGLATIPRGKFVARSLTVALRRQEGNDEIVCAHRLDRATAGLVLAVTQPQMRGAYQKLFEQKRVRKTYLAVAPASLKAGAAKVRGAQARDGVKLVRSEDARGEYWQVRSRIKKRGVAMVNAVGKVNSETIIRPASRPYELAGAAGGAVRVWEIHPVTGRTHQIRVHMAALGAPIVGDPLYGGALAGEYGSDDLPEGAVPLQLLAQRLQFTDPVDGEQVDVHSRLRLACARG